MNVLRTVLFSLLLFTFVGCGGIHYTAEDRLASMSSYESMVIPVLTATIEGNGQTKSLSQSIPLKMFFLTHSGLILGFDDTRAELVATTQVDDNNHFDLRLEWGGRDIKIEEGMKDGSIGGASPVSDDGYFITAYHVVDQESNWIACLFDKNGKPSVKSSKVRIVYADKQMDFAVIKADMSTPKFLCARKGSLREGEPLFAGNLMHPSLTAGKFVVDRSMSSKHKNSIIPFTELNVTNPVTYGDSGTPLIDSQGNLCGIITRVAWGLIKKKEAESYAMMMDVDALFRIIEEDRASNQGLQETSLSQGS